MQSLEYQELYSPLSLSRPQKITVCYKEGGTSSTTRQPRQCIFTICEVSNYTSKWRSTWKWTYKASFGFKVTLFQMSSFRHSELVNQFCYKRCLFCNACYFFLFFFWKKKDLEKMYHCFHKYIILNNKIMNNILLNKEL